MVENISFDKSKDIFGTGFDHLVRKSEDCRLFSSLMPYIDGKGRPILKTIGELDKKYLWAYIHYLAKNNIGFAWLSKMGTEEDGKFKADSKAFVTIMSQYFGTPVEQVAELTSADIASFIAHLWDLDPSSPPTVPYLNNIFALVMEKLKSEEKNTAKVYEDLQQTVEHVKQVTSQLKDIRTDRLTGANEPPRLVVTPRGDPYEMMSSVNLEVVMPKTAENYLRRN
jgi:hypothetical protein